MPICTECGVDKNEEAFSWRIKAKGLRQPKCRACAAATGRWYRQQRKEILGEKGEREYQKEKYRQHRNHRPDYYKEYYQKNKERFLRKSKEYYAQNREDQVSKARGRQLKANFGITQDDYNQMVEDQGGLCAICGKNSKALHVDHCHKTGKVRGLLCAPCNSFLGRINDSLETLDKIKAYLAQ